MADGSEPLPAALTKCGLPNRDLPLNFFKLRAFDAGDSKQIFGPLKRAGRDDRFRALGADAGQFLQISLRRSVDVDVQDNVRFWQFANGISSHRQDHDARANLLQLFWTDPFDAIEFVDGFIGTAGD